MKNHIIDLKAIRIEKEDSELIESVMKVTKLKQHQVVRVILVKQLRKLREDIMLAKGIQNLEFSVVEMRDFNN